MRAGRTFLATVLAGVALSAVVAPLQAQACMPMPLAEPRPGETEEARQIREREELQAQVRGWQLDLWTRADRVFLARVSQSEPEPPPPPPQRRYDPRRGGPPPVPPPVMVPLLDPFNGERTMVLTPVAGLKGAAPARPFDIVDSWSNTSCGPYYRFNDGGSPPGLPDDELVVVFATGPYPTKDGVLDALAVDRVIEPGIKAALDKAGAAR